MIVLLDYNVVSVTFIYTTHKSKQINKHAKKKKRRNNGEKFSRGNVTRMLLKMYILGGFYKQNRS